MGNAINWIITLPIIGFGVYFLIKSIIKEVKGGGCASCTGTCNMDDCDCK
ncbi:hypothetical protein [Wukongibacter sp. M2B1]